METNLKRQRIVFVNLHANSMLVKTFAQLLFKKSISLKHGYLLDFLIDNPTIEVCSYINKDGFSLGSKFFSDKLFLRSFLSRFRFVEHKYIMRKNRINFKKITILKKLEEIQNDDIILLYILYPQQFAEIGNIHAFKAISFVHFPFLLEETKNLINQVAPNILSGESNLVQFNKYFNDCTNWKGDFVVSPFVYENRFKPVRPFKERENKAVSMGTIAYHRDEIFKALYGDTVLQPIRKKIKIHSNDLKNYIACYNMDYHESFKDEEVLPDGNLLKQIYQRWRRNIHRGQQKQYYSFDMVDKFNEFKMCIVGEEITGVPGIGFVEGMACGCAYIGLNNGLYEQYGLKEGIHYIGYDGTLSDLIEKIKYWQRPENQNKLEEIAQCGCAYVREHFNKEAVASSFLSRLLEAHKAWKKEHMPESIKS